MPYRLQKCSLGTTGLGKGCHKGSGNWKIGVRRHSSEKKKAVDPEMLPGSITVQILEK